MNFFNKLKHTTNNYRRGLFTEEEMYKTQSEVVDDLMSKTAYLLSTPYQKKIDEYVFQSRMRGINKFIYPTPYAENVKEEYRQMLLTLKAIGLITPEECIDYNKDFKKYIDNKVYGKFDD